MEARTASEAGIYREAEEETETRLEAVPGVLRDTADRAHAPAAAAAHRAWGLVVEAALVVAVVGAAGAGSLRISNRKFVGVGA